MTAAHAVTMFFLFAGMAFCVSGVFLLFGLAWALVNMSMFCFIMAVIISRGLNRV